jgi:hypothetical protein
MLSPKALIYTLMSDFARVTRKRDRKATMTPTALTLRHLRRGGYLADVVERWIPGAKVRRDLFTVIDVIAITIGEPVLAVQCTSGANVAARLKKATACPELAVWLKDGRPVSSVRLVHGA